MYGIMSKMENNLQNVFDVIIDDTEEKETRNYLI